jgi:hypothetical protein
MFYFIRCKFKIFFRVSKKKKKGFCCSFIGVFLSKFFLLFLYVFMFSLFFVLLWLSWFYLTVHKVFATLELSSKIQRPKQIYAQIMFHFHSSGFTEKEIRMTLSSSCIFFFFPYRVGKKKSEVPHFFFLILKINSTEKLKLSIWIFFPLVCINCAVGFLVLGRRYSRNPEAVE